MIYKIQHASRWGRRLYVEQGHAETRSLGFQMRLCKSGTSTIDKKNGSYGFEAKEEQWSNLMQKVRIQN